MGLCKISYRLTSWFEAGGEGCPARDMWSILERTFCQQSSQGQCNDLIASLNRTTLHRCRFVAADYVAEISEVTDSKWTPCGICSNAPPNPCNFGGSFCNRYIFRTDGTPDCGESNYTDCVDGLILQINNPVGCCPRVGAAYNGCYNSESSTCCAQAGDSILANHCSFYQTDPCVKGCCCTTGCTNVSTNVQCPQGCTPKASGLACSGTNDPECGGGCCLCDRCCDMSATDCAARGGTAITGSCGASATQTTCKNSNARRSCVSGIWSAARRPAAHFPSNIGTPALFPPAFKSGRWEPASIAKQRNLDRPGGSYSEAAECRMSYGWLERAEGRWDAKICNTYNNRCASGKKTQKLKLTRVGGRWEWRGAYRPPCPEESDMGCATTVGCPA